MKQHELLHERLFKFKCFSCPQGFNKKSNLSSHILTHHPQFENYITNKIHQCDFCSYKNISSHNLKFHILKHFKNNLIKYNCEKCNFGTPCVKLLHRHLLSRCKKRPYRCETFCEICSSQIDLITRNTHLPKYQCDKCQYQCLIKGSLKTHVLIHSRHKPYQCDVCYKQFTRKRGLNSHIFTKHKDHNSNITVKIHTCNICSYKTINSSYLRKHKLGHQK